MNITRLPRVNSHCCVLWLFDCSRAADRTGQDRVSFVFQHWAYFTFCMCGRHTHTYIHRSRTMVSRASENTHGLLLLQLTTLILARRWSPAILLKTVDGCVHLNNPNDDLCGSSKNVEIWKNIFSPPKIDFDWYYLHYYYIIIKYTLKRSKRFLYWRSLYWIVKGKFKS